ASSPAELGGRLVLAGLSNSPFLYGYGAPRALPSFPTRRSSDLAGDAGMASTAKHFPTHAGVRADSHTEAAVDRREYTELLEDLLDRKSTRLNSSHVKISYAVFCLKKKKSRKV